MVSEANSPLFLKSKPIIAPLKNLGKKNEDVIASLLANHSFENEEVLDLMFANPIRSIPPINIGDSSGVSTSTRKGKEKVVETPVSKKKV